MVRKEEKIDKVNKAKIGEMSEMRGLAVRFCRLKTLHDNSTCKRDIAVRGKYAGNRHIRLLAGEGGQQVRQYTGERKREEVAGDDREQEVGLTSYEGEFGAEEECLLGL